MPTALGPQTTEAITLNFSVIAIETERYKMYFLWIIGQTFTFDILGGNAEIPKPNLARTDVFSVCDQWKIEVIKSGQRIVWNRMCNRKNLNKCLITMPLQIHLKSFYKNWP